MRDDTHFSLRHGFVTEDASNVAQLFWATFENKLGLIMKPEDKALNYLTEVANPNHAICAFAANGELIGVAG
ncbi:hypothetical protein [Cochlodiniinecator piscidefendens]|uniref:hypothetical protein n=1 Tax=Cochlodiniinecator piscidefendens TaxID=2715756 RepID=UPI00140E8EE9|nr:hypothetical protein [Cochlodiniinecator piscidefendens]